MENNKYFTPDIEDLHIEYECEIYGQCTSKLIKKVEWHPVKVNDSPEMSKYVGILQCKKLIKTHHIRVPYLTKEQIEAEGFVYRGKISHRTIPSEPFTKIELEFIKNNILIRFDVISNKVMIDKADSTEENVNFYNVKTLYHGECKDINTFRKIIKLLKI